MIVYYVHIIEVVIMKNEKTLDKLLAEEWLYLSTLIIKEMKNHKYNPSTYNYLDNIYNKIINNYTIYISQKNEN